MVGGQLGDVLSTSWKNSIVSDIELFESFGTWGTTNTDSEGADPGPSLTEGVASSRRVEDEPMRSNTSN